MRLKNFSAGVLHSTLWGDYISRFLWLAREGLKIRAFTTRRIAHLTPPPGGTWASEIRVQHIVWAFFQTQKRSPNRAHRKFKKHKKSPKTPVLQTPRCVSSSAELPLEKKWRGVADEEKMHSNPPVFRTSRQSGVSGVESVPGDGQVWGGRRDHSTALPKTAKMPRSVSASPQGTMSSNLLQTDSRPGRLPTHAPRIHTEQAD